MKDEKNRLSGKRTGQNCIVAEVNTHIEVSIYVPFALSREPDERSKGARSWFDRLTMNGCRDRRICTYTSTTLYYVFTRKVLPCLWVRGCPFILHPSSFILLFLLTFLTGNAAYAHIGSPNVYYEGNAGAYPVRVVVRPPDAIPGRAEVTVTVNTAVSRVSVLPAPADAPDAGLPPADAARPVPGAANVFSAEIWIMTLGSCAIRIHVGGAQGEGAVVVPMNAVNLTPTPMSVWLKTSLFVLGMVLMAGVIVIAGAIAREGNLPPGVMPTEKRRRMAKWVAAVTGLATVLVTGAGWTLWQNMDRDYRNNQLYRPLPVSATATSAGPDRLLTLTRLPDERGNRAWPVLTTDHGKLMHAFLLREPDLDAFAHIHPFPTEQGAFVSAIPPLPGGSYRLYADITQENGLSQTLTTSVTLPEPPAAGLAPGSARIAPDPDDSWRIGKRFAPPGQPVTTSTLADGYRIIWENPEAGHDPAEGALRFAVVDPAGSPAALEPYMGMMGHAAIRREDGAVFTHLHPTGSISMAAQDLLTRKNRGPDASSMAGMDHSMHTGQNAAQVVSRIVFPYEFPRNGPYRIWVQVRASGQVMTGIFDVRVNAVR